MGMEFNVYVGPYLQVPKNEYSVGTLESMESLVTDGRGESGVNEPFLTVVPNVKVEGIERQKYFDRHSGDPIVAISPVVMPDNKNTCIVQEILLFEEFVKPFIQELKKHDLEAKVFWGVVTKWA